jgi:hypothetical protein
LGSRTLNTPHTETETLICAGFAAGVYRVTASTLNITATLHGCAVRNVSVVIGGGNLKVDLLIGQFRLTDGRIAILIVNQDDRRRLWPSLDFGRADKNGTVLEIDKKTGAEAPVRTDSWAMPGVTLSLDSGDARLFVKVDDDDANNPQQTSQSFTPLFLSSSSSAPSARHGASALAVTRGGTIALGVAAAGGGDLLGRASCSGGVRWGTATAVVTAQQLGGGRLLNPSLVADRAENSTVSSSSLWLLLNRDPPGAETMQNCTFPSCGPSPACHCYFSGAARQTFVVRLAVTCEGSVPAIQAATPINLDLLPGAGTHRTVSPGRGVQLSSGRLVFQVSHWKGDVCRGDPASVHRCEGPPGGKWLKEYGDHRYHAHIIFSDNGGRVWNRTNGGITAPCHGCPQLLGRPLPCPAKQACSNPLLNTLVALPTDWDAHDDSSRRSILPHCVGEACPGDVVMVDSYNLKCLQNVSTCPSKSCGNFCEAGQNRLGWLVSDTGGVNYTYRQPVPVNPESSKGQGSDCNGQTGAGDCWNSAASNGSTIYKAGLARWDGILYWLTLNRTSEAAMEAQLWLSSDNGRHFTSAWMMTVCDDCAPLQPMGEEHRLRATIAVTGETLMILVDDAKGTSWLLRQQRAAWPLTRPCTRLLTDDVQGIPHCHVRVDPAKMSLEDARNAARVLNSSTCRRVHVQLMPGRHVLQNALVLSTHADSHTTWSAAVVQEDHTPLLAVTISDGVHVMNWSTASDQQQVRPALKTTDDAAEECDVVVIGGSVAGLSAAVTSAKEGATTCLLEPTDMLGGQMTSNGIPALDFSPEECHGEQYFSNDTRFNTSSAPSTQDANMANDFPALLRSIHPRPGYRSTCWVSCYCYLPTVLARGGITALVASAGDKLKVFTQTVLLGADTAALAEAGGSQATKITSVSAVQRTATAASTEACPEHPGYGAQLSKALPDWYSPTPSAAFEKKTLRFSLGQ